MTFIIPIASTYSMIVIRLMNDIVLMTDNPSISQNR